MTFATKDLSVLAYSNGFTLWHYTTADSMETVGAPDYFNHASNMLRVGDILVTNTSIDSALQSGLWVVSATTSQSVTTAGMCQSPAPQSDVVAGD